MGLRAWLRGLGFLILSLLVLVVLYQGNYNRVNLGVTLEGTAVGGWSRGKVQRLVENLAARRERLPENAYLDLETGEIVPEKPGVEVDVEGTVQQVLLALPGEEVELMTREVPANITRESLAAERAFCKMQLRQIGSGRTPILDDRPARVNNIQVATAMISGLELAHGKEFSFNRVVGVPTAARGFKEAPVIDDTGEFIPEIGGGICQVSSTLYQAACAAGLEILERHGHSQAIDYTPPGTDATIVPGEKDLRFRNNRERSVIILGTANSREVHFVILEQRD